MSTIVVDVALGERSYPIRIGRGLLADASCWRSAISGRHVLVVSNTTIAPLYLERVVAGLDGYAHASLILADGEQHKTLDNVAHVFDALARSREPRWDPDRPRCA